MRIALIAAMDRNRVIGRDNTLPWHLPADLAFFKRMTLGKPVLMGRRTHESIGRPLPRRTNIVVSGQAHYDAPGCIVVPDLETGLATAEGADELMVIGGASLFEALLPRANRLYLTEVATDVVGGDTWFPAYEPAEWHVVEESRHPRDARNAYAMRFLVMERAR